MLGVDSFASSLIRKGDQSVGGQISEICRISEMHEL